MVKHNISSYEQIIKNLIYENRMLKESRAYTLGKRMLSTWSLIKKFKIIKIFSILKIIYKGKQFNKKFTDLPQTILEKPQQDIPTIQVPDNTPSVTVYTCITGNYDSPAAPLVHYSNCQYLLFTDNPEQFKDVKGWIVLPIPDVAKKYKLPNRYLKYNPKDVCKTEYSIYIDGNIQLLAGTNEWIPYTQNEYGVAMFNHPYRNCLYREGEACISGKKGNSKKIKEQLYRYKQEGFPKNYGLIETSIIVTDLSNIKAIEILKDCWEEFKQSQSGRDQLALPYILWKKNIAIEKIYSLGSDVRKDIHLQHKLYHIKNT